MTSRRLGATVSSRLSILPSVLRRMANDGATVTRDIWQIDAQGAGTASYSVPCDGKIYTLIVNGHSPSIETTGKVAHLWDVSFVLREGLLTPEELDLFRSGMSLDHADLQEYSVRGRAVKNMGFIDHLVRALRRGAPPDPGSYDGHLMRFSWSGKSVTSTGLRRAAMRLEMLALWLLRGFALDLVEHLGGGQLDRDLKRSLGLEGAINPNATPFLFANPDILSDRVLMRETALARLRGIPALTGAEIKRLAQSAARHATFLNLSSDAGHLQRDWADLCNHLNALLDQPQPIDQLMRVSEIFEIECQELLVSFLIDSFGVIVDDLADAPCEIPAPFDPDQSVKAMVDQIRADYAWALEDDSSHRVAQDIRAFLVILNDASGTVGSVLAKAPQHAEIATRIQLLSGRAYGEMREAGPEWRTDLTRFHLSCIGARELQKKSENAVRFSVGSDAPLLDELHLVPRSRLPVFRSHG